jgi:hypothetical protein
MLAGRANGGQVVLDNVLPNATLTGVLATGVEDQNGFAGDWSVTSYAICANPSDAAPLRFWPRRRDQEQ